MIYKKYTNVPYNSLILVITNNSGYITLPEANGRQVVNHVFLAAAVVGYKSSTSYEILWKVLCSAHAQMLSRVENKMIEKNCISWNVHAERCFEM